MCNQDSAQEVSHLKRLLQESKSEENILTKTFSTKFIGNEEYKTLSQIYENGHSKKIGSQFRKNNYDNEDSFFRKTQSQLFSKYNINPSMEKKEKELLM